MYQRTKEFIVRTAIFIFFGYTISYYLSIKIPHFLNITQNEKLMVSNLLFIIIFIICFLYSYLLRFKFAIGFSLLFGVLAVAI